MRNKNDITNEYGFFCTYFELLPLYKTQRDAFNALNNEVGFITGSKQFKSFKKFNKWWRKTAS